MSSWADQLAKTIDPAVRQSKAIEAVVIGDDVLDRAPALLARHFRPDDAIVLIADSNTMTAAGDRLVAILEGAGIAVHQHLFPGSPRLKPTIDAGDAILDTLKKVPGVPLVVGSGVLNDLGKFAAFRAGRPYFCVATAASMDGYASAGAPLSAGGFKNTIQCAPPKVILADLAVLARAPADMAGWGYGDLAGKMPAGADWILADHLGIEAIDDLAWPLVQDNLRGWLADPDAVAQAGKPASAALMAGLILSGFAMEFHGSSRPASGADHQVAHLWEMQDVRHHALPVAHGACVALGTLTVLSLYDWLLEQDLTTIDDDEVIRARPGLDEEIAHIVRQFGKGTVADRSVEETTAKFAADDVLRARIEKMTATWPALRRKLRTQLVSTDRMRSMLATAGVVTHPAQVGMAWQHHRQTVCAARYIRRRYTVLDFLADAGLLDSAVDAVFGPHGVWAEVGFTEVSAAAR